MKIAFWVMFCASVLSRSRALDCKDSACLNKLCPLMKGPTSRRIMFKCPHDNYCLEYSVELWYDGTEKGACEYCPQGGNKKVCSEWCNQFSEYTYCDSNVTKCYYNYEHCDGVDHCPNKSDEKECSSYNNKINPACKGRTSVNQCADHCASGDEQDNKCVEEYCRGLKLDDNWSPAPDDDYLKDHKIIAAYGNNVSFQPCPNSTKCYSVVEQCDGRKDCPNGEDEEQCDKASREKLGKI